MWLITKSVPLHKSSPRRGNFFFVLAFISHHRLPAFKASLESRNPTRKKTDELESEERVALQKVTKRRTYDETREMREIDLWLTVLAVKRDIPLVQRFNHLIVKYVSASPEKTRSERKGDEHEGLGSELLHWLFQLAPWRLNTQKLSSNKEQQRHNNEIYIIIYDFFSSPSHDDTFFRWRNIHNNLHSTHMHSYTMSNRINYFHNWRFTAIMDWRSYLCRYRFSLWNFKFISFLGGFNEREKGIGRVCDRYLWD